MRSQPRPQQGPETFHRVDVNFMKAIAVVVASILLLPVIDREVFVTPFLQSRVDVVLVGIDRGVQGNRGFEKRCDRCLLNVLQHVEHDLARTLNHSQNWWFLFRQSTPSAITFQTPPTTLPSFF